MRKFLCLLLLCLCGMIFWPQQAAAVDSMRMALEKSVANAERAYWMDMLSRTLMNVSLDQSDEYGKKLITLAEESRDTKLMVMAYNPKGTRCSYRAGIRDGQADEVEKNNCQVSSTFVKMIL